MGGIDRIGCAHPNAAAGVLCTIKITPAIRTVRDWLRPSQRCRGRHCTIKQKKMRSSKLGASFSVLWCGKSGIQTHGTLKAYAGFRVRSIRSLWHLSVCKITTNHLLCNKKYDFFLIKNLYGVRRGIGP